MTAFRGLFVRKDSTRGTTPIEARRALAGLLHRTSSGAPRQGLLSPVQVVGTGGWAYSVPAAWWVTSRGLADGVVLAGSDGVVSVPTDPAPASGSRIDVIYVLHRDVDRADANSESIIAVAVGVASGTPTAPTIPAGAMEIARATVASTNANTLAATITQTAPYTGLAGAEIVVPFGQGEFAARIPSPPDGLRVHSLAENAVYVRSGGAWVHAASLPAPRDTVQVTITALGGSIALQMVRQGGYVQATVNAVANFTSVGEVVASTGGLVPAGFRPPVEVPMNLLRNTNTTGAAPFLVIVTPSGQVQVTCTQTGAFRHQGSAMWIAT